MALLSRIKPEGGVNRVASPVLFPTSWPRPKLFSSTQELRKGYEAVAEEKVKVHPTFDLQKTYPIDRHVRLINTSDPPRRQNVKPLNMRMRQSLQKPMPVPTTGPQNFRLQLQPQVLDIDLTWRIVEEKEKVYSSRPSLFPQLLTKDMRQAIRVAEAMTERQMIEEVLNLHELEKMLCDSYANYVVQTAMDWANSETRQNLIDNIRPLPPAIRTTPYGRRIQSKSQVAEGRSANSSGLNTPSDATSPGQTSQRQLPSSSFHQHQFSASQLASSLMNGTYGNGGFSSGGAGSMNVGVTPTSGGQKLDGPSPSLLLPCKSGVGK
ncbi:MAG: hypothetical protein M1839_005917 [Geoglossum umbratile]|nr:MAG: hypothetical protein M1839_005917 [Geoglossum umbratile]